jgi:hypothetical protein
LQIATQKIQKDNGIVRTITTETGTTSKSLKTTKTQIIIITGETTTTTTTTTIVVETFTTDEAITLGTKTIIIIIIIIITITTTIIIVTITTISSPSIEITIETFHFALLGIHLVLATLLEVYSEAFLMVEDCLDGEHCIFIFTSQFR